LGETERHGILRESRVVLLTGEAFLLRRGCDFAILNQGGGTVVVKSGDAKDPHRSVELKQRVDEWCNGGALDENQQQSKNQHEQHHRKKPVPLPDAKK
jgi:hypothetical protein